MKKITLLFAILIFFALTSFGQIISQYIDTNVGTTPKGIEIWNNTTSVLDFSTNTLAIKKGTNGNLPVIDYTLSTGSLAVGAVLVIGTSDMQIETENNGSDFYLKAFTFNGNDALEVWYGATKTDVFGEPGVDPGTGWSGNGVQTWDQNIQLLSGITSGDTDGWTDPSTRFETVCTNNCLTGFGIAPSGSENQAPEITNISNSPVFPNSSDAVSVSADVTDDVSVSSVICKWGLIGGGPYANTIAMALSAGNTYFTTSSIPAQSNGTTVYFVIEATDGELLTTTSPQHSYTVLNLLINEADADTPGTDAAEFIELYDGGIGNADLSGFVVVLFNGSNDLSYDAFDLDGYNTDANGYFVIGSTGMGTDIEVEPGGSGWLQNGADAVALYTGNASDFPNGTTVTTTGLIDALVYDTDDADDPGLLVLLNPGQPQVNENGRLDGDIQSMQRIANGSGGQRNTITYDELSPTPGAENIRNITSWLGSTSSAWNVSSNWNNGVPEASFNVTIADVTNSPVISSPSSCFGLTLNSGSALDISVNGSLTVYGDLDAASGTLTVKSDDTGNGSLIVEGLSTGSATVQRYFVGSNAGADNGWHNIGSPVDSMLISASDFNPGESDELYQWDEPTNSWENYKDADTFQYFINGNGYRCAFENTGVKEFVGTLNTGDITIPGLTKVDGGFNLLGNPYASTLIWNNGDWILDNVGATAQIWEEANNNYTAISANGIIPSTNGFFVEVATAAGGSVTIPASARTHDATNNYKNIDADSNQETIDLKVTNDANTYYDITRIGFKENATEAWNIEYDAHKLFGGTGTSQIWSVVNDENFVFNYLPFVYASYQVPIYFRAGVNDTHHITAQGIDSFFGNSEIYLEDLQTEEFINLTEQHLYSFTATTDDAEGRFILHFFSVTSVDEPVVATNAAQIYSSGQTVYIRFNELTSNNSQVEVYNTIGQQVYTEQLTTQGLSSIQLNEKPGIYIVRLRTENGLTTQKVMIK